MDTDYLNYCRLCMCEDDLKEMDTLTIDIIQNEFSIEIHADEELSKEICCSCDGFLSKYVAFKNKVNKTQTLLRKILGRKRKDVNNESMNLSMNADQPSSRAKNKHSEPVISLIENPPKPSSKSPKPRRSDIEPQPVISLIDEYLNTNKKVKKKSLNDNAEPSVSLDESSKTNRKSSEAISQQKGWNVSTVSTAESRNITNDNSKANTLKKDSNDVDENLITKIIKSINLAEVERNSAEISNWNPEIGLCQLCNSKISDFAEYQKHITKKVHMFKSYVTKKLGNPTLFNDYRVGYTCKVCNTIFSNKSTMCEHSKESHKQAINRNLICPDTIIRKKKSDDTKNKIQMEENIKQEPGIEKQKNFKCRFCDKYFGFVESLRRHHQKHHKDIFLCSHCPHASKNRKAFVNHLREHYDLTFYQKMCSQCFKICETQQALATHRKEVHEGIVFLCTICDIKFCNSTSLKLHKRVHRAQNEAEKEESYTCKRCNRSFLSKLVLDKHQCMKLRYPCSKECHRRFSTYSEMVRHSIKCTLGTTIYRCQHCRKNLKTITTLQRHLLKCSRRLASTSMAGTSQDSKTSNPTPDSVKKVVRDPQSSSTNSDQSTPAPKKIKISSGKLGEKNVFNCKKCLKKITSIKELDEHTKKCLQCKSSLIIRTKKVKKVKRLATKPKVAKKSPTKSSKVDKIAKKTEIIKIESKAESKISNKDSTSNDDFPCKVCGVVLKSKLFLNAHRFTAHPEKTTTLPSTSFPSKDPIPDPNVKTPLKDQRDEDKTPDSSKPKSNTPLEFSKRYEKPHEIRYLDIPLPRREERFSAPALDLSNKKIFPNPPIPPEKIEKAKQNLRFDDRASPRMEQRLRPYSPQSFNREVRNFLSQTSSIKFDRTEQRHYRPPNKFSPGYSKGASVSPGTSRKLLKPDYLNKPGRKTSDITIIPNNPDTRTCKICRNTAPHLFCSPCARCFIQNEVQYLNHMKMKHSGKSK